MLHPPLHMLWGTVTHTEESSPQKNSLYRFKNLEKPSNLKKKHNDLVKELRKLDLELTAPGGELPTPPCTPKKTHDLPPPTIVSNASNKPIKRDPLRPSLNLFPVTEIRGPKREGEEEEGDPVRHHERLGFKTLKELKSAVTQYGPVAPFTLSLLDSLDDMWLTPNDWYHLARATLSGGDFVLWKSEFSEICKETARSPPPMEKTQGGPLIC